MKIIHDVDVSFQISIIDSGGGISEEGIKNLFMDFSKLDENSSRNRLGTGLGLSICKKITEQLSGSLTVNSKVGAGTCFTLHMSTKCQSRPESIFLEEGLKDIGEEPVQIENIPDFLKYKKKHAHIFAKKERLEEEIEQCLLPMNDKNQRIITNALKFMKDFEEKLQQIY